jgi:hypothetical protein
MDQKRQCRDVRTIAIKNIIYGDVPTDKVDALHKTCKKMSRIDFAKHKQLANQMFEQNDPDPHDAFHF